MISRLTLAAAVFAVLATATLTFAAESRQQQRAEPARNSAVVTAAGGIVVLPRVEVIGHRTR